MNLDQFRAKQTIARILFPVALLALFFTSATGWSFSALYALGDSLSDTGRNPAPAPSYYNGRYSNGPLWVEYLSAELGLTYNAANNFAVSGDTTSNLASQVAGVVPSTNLSSALFTVWIAGNDFLDSADIGVNDPAWAVVISNAVVNITNALGTLYTDGAREIIVGNLPNLGQIPAFVGTPAGYTNYIDSKVALFNTTLASALTSVMQRYPGLRIYPVDFNSTFTATLNSPGTYGFTVTTVGALEDTNLTNKSFTGPGADYLFWDTIHPTTKAHALNAGVAFLSVGVELSSSGNGINSSLVVSNLSPGLSYTIQSSANLATWTNYQILTATSNNATVTVTNALGANAYYRVRY